MKTVGLLLAFLFLISDFQVKSFEIMNSQVFQGDVLAVRIEPQWQGPLICVSALGEEYHPNKKGFVFVGVGADEPAGIKQIFRVECGRGVQLDPLPGEFKVLKKSFKKTRVAGGGVSMFPRKQPELDVISNAFKTSNSNVWVGDITDGEKHEDPSDYLFSVKYRDIIHPFGFIYRNNKQLFHSGVDLKMPIGTPVKAVNQGHVVLAVENYSKEGTMIILYHGLGVFSVYMHLSKLDTQHGQIVEKGQVIGLSGDTGNAKGGPPHLHFNMRIKNNYVDPLAFIDFTNQYLD